MDSIEFMLNGWSEPFRSLVRPNENFGSEAAGGVVDGILQSDPSRFNVIE